ncbi:DUF6884 domain-containing protein [Salipiger sp.]|uniref:DUF6884 domain-containing protein n=1 Tax=Salipiger sp. TaxID=2078585 RepID=UPI003A96957F
MDELKSSKRVALVSCVKTKSNHTLPAKDLYISDWFKKARALVERSGTEWFILSAEHGLLDPDDEIQPYERTLKTMGVAERRAWAARVAAQMETKLPGADEIIVLAGMDYRAYLMPYLRSRFASVVIPMEGLTSGRQLNWLEHAKTI